MTDSVCEKKTRHYRGRWFGFGPVRNAEQVVLAIFARTNRNGSRLSPKSFSRANLSSDSLSVARTSVTAKETFVKFVKLPGEAQKGPFVGAAMVKVASLRDLVADIQVDHTVQKVRSICVYDRVDSGDFDGHATIGYAPSTSAGRSQPQIAKIRAKIDLDLADTFSEILPFNEVAWSGRGRIKFERLRSCARIVWLIIAHALKAAKAT